MSLTQVEAVKAELEQLIRASKRWRIRCGSRPAARENWS